MSGLRPASDAIAAIATKTNIAASTMTGATGVVSDSMESIAAVSHENSAGAEEVSAATEEMAAQVEEVVASAASLKEMAGELDALVARFKLDAGEGQRTGSGPVALDGRRGSAATPESRGRRAA
jgi:methyl-accepting chemotaxis protein